MKFSLTAIRHALGFVSKPTALRRFAGARMSHTTQGFQSTEQSINQELRSDLNKLRARGRDLVKNNDYVRKFAAMVRINVVGPKGFVLQARVEDKPGRADAMANKAIEAAFRKWSRRCEVSQRQSFKDFCETLVGGMPSDGEFLVRMIKGADAGNEFNFALQCIDVDRIDTLFNQGATASTNAVIMGVEVNAYRRPVALHLFVAHPSDGVHGSRRRERVPSEELIHCFKSEFAEQVRGIPWVASSMLSLHHLGAFQLSAVQNAEHGAKRLGFFITPDGASPLQGDANDVISVQDLQYDTLPAGTTVEVPDSQYPNDVFAPFVSAILRRISSGLGVSHHSLANDLEGVSFSSIRSGTLEERDRWMSDQTWFTDCFLEPVYDEWLKMALLSGAITMPNGSALPASKISKFNARTWQPRRWEWVDPSNDMDAKINAVKAGFAAPQDVVAQMGQGDFNDVMQKIAEAQTLAKTLGISLPAFDAHPGAQPAAPAPKPQKE